MRLITLPLTLVRLPLKAAGAALSIAQDLVGGDVSTPAPTSPAPQPRFVREEPQSRPRTRAAGNGGAPPAAAPAAEPAHVSEEPTVVAETAEPGAEGGAGAEVRVDEPWP